ncbi:hypothetical protein [Acidocella sp.]|uniref:DUF3024 domain-containing protein n=1 Tax=Acidocella sp. TaxID=50710 RepID=UPI0017A64A94|nr:hypothetical protein [Acidocella sp.]NNM57805.1 hypothetical protein [Acidocella sp.]
MAPHPNEFDQHRIERALARRVRYRYVAPRVVAEAGGYKVESPCCSRNVDTEGDVIDIALIQYDAAERLWCLSRKNHKAGEWLLVNVFGTLHELLAVLTEDASRKFWQ